MGSGGMQIVCVALAIFGLIGAILCCALPKWRETSFVGENIVTAQTTQEGIWMTCVIQSTGQMLCKSYDSLLVLPQDLQVARALTIISIILVVFGILTLFFGAEFTTFIDNESVKSKIALTSGIILIVAGILLIIPVSWSANIVIRNFYDSLVVRKMELGACIFIGWAASVILFIAGGLICFFRPKGTDPNFSAKYYSHSNPTAPAAKNYV
ncbi:claudin-4-like [Protopterus annectens]|uniref:claudin-4-like n=1 Tax=Protopterus annectens TaxID=7888 RepID=UPI001CFB5933|nr:claudin-4-like [Protopterus annectens]